MTKRMTRKRKPTISALEPRILFDGAAVTTAIDVLDNNSFTDSTTDDTQNDVTQTEPITTQPQTRREIAFVDTSVEDYQTLVEGIGENVEVYEISSTDEIEAILQNLQDLDAIHILSHGSTGEITIGSETINSETLTQFSDTLEVIKNSLSDDGDILLYGCNVASDGEGQDFIDEIATLTEADVAASDDITGSAELGGDWVLEVESGRIETDEIQVGNYTISLDNDVSYNLTPTIADASGGRGDYAQINIEVDGTGSGTLTINAYDVDYADGERNQAYFLQPGDYVYSSTTSAIIIKDSSNNIVTNSRVLGYLQGSNSADVDTTFTNVAFSGTGTAKVIIWGAPDPDGSGTSWGYTINSASFVATGNSAPYFTSSASASLNEDGSVNITVAGRDGGTLNDNVTLSLDTNPSHGTISGFVTQSGSTIASDTFTYTPNSDYYGSDTIKFKLTDGIDTVYQTINITVNAVNDTPTVQATIPTQSLSEDFSSYTIDLKSYFQDVETSDTSLTYTYSGNSNIGVSISNGVATISSATANWNGSETITFFAKDASNASVGQNVIFNVAAVNDAPVITLANGTTETIDEDTSLTFSGTKAITLADADNTGTETFDLTLSVSNGVLDLSTTSGLTFLAGSDLSGSMTIRGTLSALQTAINGLTYSPNADWYGSDNLEITFNDRGNTGAGNVLEDSQTIAITVNSVNDVPVIDSAVDINITDGSGISIIEDSITNYMKVSDPDTTSLEYTIVGGSVSGTTVTNVGTYGTLTIDSSTGKYVFTPNETAIAALTSNTVESFVLDVFDGTTHVQTTVNVNITAEGQSSATYTEQDPATLILQDTSIETTALYGGGYIEFEVSSPEATEILSLQKVITADITDGVVSIVGSTIYLGDGTTAKAIGQIDGTYNGEDGKALRINFAVDFNNGTFNSTADSTGLLSSTTGAVINIDGWTIINDRVEFGEDTIAGLATPIDSIWPWKTYKNDSDNYQDDSGDLSSSTFKTYINEDSSGDNSIQMYSTMWSEDGYEVIRGPYIYSDSAVSLEAGDTVQFDWKAEGGGDAYDVFGYIIDVNDETNYQVILNETGANASAQTSWATESISVDKAGEYIFVFVSGTWDATGGTLLGAQLYIDDVKVVQANPPSGIESDVLEKIAQLVTYENTGDLTANNDVQNKTITVTTSSGDATPIVHTDTKALVIQEINDIPTLVQPTTIYYTDTVATDDFSDESGTLVASDVDSGTTFTYDITGSTDNNDGTVSKVGSYGTLTVNKTTGAYTFAANDNAINALGESIIETFAVTVNDGDGGVATKNIIVDITAVNDGPVLGGAKPGDIESDTYGAYSPISYTENSAPVVIDSTITVTDPETKSYEDGMLKISVTSNANSGDQLTLTTTGGISIDGSNVLYGSAIIGTIDSTYNGVDGKDLIINLTDKAYSAEVQALMRAVSYSSSNDAFVNLSRTITMEINDGGNGGVTTAAISTKDAIVNITPINDIPVIDSGSSAFEMEKVLGSTTIGSSEDGSMYLNGISFRDVDETGNVTVVLSTTNTTPQTDIISVTSVSTGTTYTWGDGTNFVSVVATSSDDIYTIADNLVSAINNDATLSQDYTAIVSGKMDGKFTITSNSLEEFTSSVSGISSLTIQEVYGLLTVKENVTNGVTTITGNGTKEVTLVGTIDEINTTLAEIDGLTYVAGDGNDSVTPGVNSLNISITDSLGAEVTYTKEVVVLPAVPNSFSSNVTLSEDSSITYDIGSLIADINDNSGTYIFGTVGTVGETHINENQVDTISLPDIPSGSYTWTDGSGITASGTSVSALISDINSKFTSKYIATVDSNPSVFTITTVNSADEFTSVVTGTGILKLDTLAKGAVVIDSIGSITAFSSNSIIENTNGDDIGYQLDGGTLILENDQVLGTDFAKFTFTPDTNWNGTETIYYQYISGDGTISPVSKVLFYTSAVNDAPTITSNLTQEVAEDTSIAFNTTNSNRIVIDDLDVTSEELELTLDVSNGKLTLGSTSNLTFLEGTNNSAHIVIKGSLTSLQAALDNMSYQANENYYGSDSLEINLSDLGNIGTLGDILTDSRTIDITVTNVNDAPVLEVLNSTISENESTISQSGLVKFTDIDKEDLPTLSQDLTAIEYLAQDGTTPLTLTTTQLSDIENAFSLAIASGNTNSGSATWSFDIAESKLDFLAHGEVVTAIFTITVNDQTGESNSSSSQDVTITITGTNDTPLVNTLPNLDESTPFGKEYRKEMAIYFTQPNIDAKLDTTDTSRFVYSAYNLPGGLSIDAQTGVISGGAVVSGPRTITVRATDPYGAYGERSFELLVIAPAQPASADTTSAKNTSEAGDALVINTMENGKISDNFDVVLNEIIMQEAENRSDTADGTTSAPIQTDIGGSGANTQDMNVELTSVANNRSTTADSKIIQASTDLSVDQVGSIEYTEKTTAAFSTVGLVIEKVNFERDNLEIKIIDSRVGQKYSVTLQDGSPLPETMSFDPNTGLISGKLPEDMKELSLSIKAMSNDGTTRVLNIKIDENSLNGKNANEEKGDKTNDKQAMFKSFKDQLRDEYANMKTYGNYVASLFG